MSNPSFDLIVLSHLRWDFVFQRPQHLLSRFDRGRVFFFEEPIFDSEQPRLEVSERGERVRVAVPHLPAGMSPEEVLAQQERMLTQMIQEQHIERYARWYYTAEAVRFSRHLRPVLTIYDCMDELSLFKGANSEIRQLELELFKMADLVFTGGVSLYEAKRTQHHDVHAFPSSVDVKHFASALQVKDDPADQASIPHPRVGYYGVIDERLDYELLEELAKMRPDLHLVMVGPFCKVNPDELPKAPNIHYLGGKDYKELPKYLSGWDVAMMPFARNDATRFISPTKTPEYLAGGRPVVSTSITDVIRPYQALGLVHIADAPADFSKAIDAALSEDAAARRKRAQEFLSGISWDATWSKMQGLIDARLETSKLQQAAS